MRERVKRILKRVPGARAFHREIVHARRAIVIPGEISTLLEQDRTVVLHPFLGLEVDPVAMNAIAEDAVRDILSFHRTARTPRKAAHRRSVPEGAVLLRTPMALLRVPATHEEYSGRLAGKVRNKIRKAAKEGYEFSEFIWNDYLDDIYEVNLSKESRQGGSMHGWYARPVEPRYRTEHEMRYLKYYGMFRDGRLRAYAHLVLCGDFAYPKHIIGHAQHLTYGVMNGLISGLVNEYAGNPEMRWLNYGILPSAYTSLEVFKMHAGFEAFATFLDLDGHVELHEYARKMRSAP